MVLSVWVTTAAILLFFLLLLPLILLNSGSDKVFEIVKPIAFAVAGAWVYVLVAVILPDPESQEKKFQVSIFSEPGPEFLRLTSLDAESSSITSQLILDSLWRDAYGQSTVLDLQGIPPSKLRQRTSMSPEEKARYMNPEHELFLDLLELAFFDWLRRNYESHWSVEYTYHEGFGGGGYSIRPKPGSESQVKRVNLVEILNYLKENRIVKSGARLGSLTMFAEADPRMFEGLTLPKGSYLVDERRKSLEREIRISKWFYFDLTIKFKHIGTVHGLRTGRAKLLAEKLKLDKDTANNLVMHAFEATFLFERWRLNRWSPSVLRYSEWADQMAGKFEREFGWANLRRELEKAIGG